jgi:hypothetical protein
MRLSGTDLLKNRPMLSRKASRYEKLNLRNVNIIALVNLLKIMHLTALDQIPGIDGF